MPPRDRVKDTLLSAKRVACGGLIDLVKRESSMRAKMPVTETDKRTLALLRSAKSKDQYKYSPGGRQKRRTRPIPSLPKLSFIDDGERRSE